MFFFFSPHTRLAPTTKQYLDKYSKTTLSLHVCKTAFVQQQYALKLAV